MQASEIAPEERHRYVKFFEYLPRIAAAAVIIIGTSVLVGWAADIPALRAISDTSPMMPSTAVCFILCGVALLLQTKNAQRWALFTSSVLCAIVLLVAVVTALEHVLDRNLGLDLLLF